MNTSETILNQIRPSHCNDATISAALDAFREDRNCGLMTAVLAVASAYRAGERAEQLATVVAFLDELNPRSGWIRRRILRESPVQPTGPVRIDVVEGDSKPVFTWDTYSVTAGQWAHPTCTVGAGWVLAVLAVEAPALNQQRAKKAARRAAK